MARYIRILAIFAFAFLSGCVSKDDIPLAFTGISFREFPGAREGDPFWKQRALMFNFEIGKQRNPPPPPIYSDPEEKYRIEKFQREEEWLRGNPQD